MILAVQVIIDSAGAVRELVAGDPRERLEVPVGCRLASATLLLDDGRLADAALADAAWARSELLPALTRVVAKRLGHDPS